MIWFKMVITFLLQVRGVFAQPHVSTLTCNLKGQNFKLYMTVYKTKSIMDNADTTLACSFLKLYEQIFQLRVQNFIYLNTA